MTREEIEQIEKKVSETSRGPWRFIKRSKNELEVLLHHGPEDAGYSHWSYMRPNDAKFVMDAREDVPKLLAHIKELEKCLSWYVANDDTNSTSYNEPWLEGKRQAMKVLGMEDPCGDD